jgi:hypothetical protein
MDPSIASTKLQILCRNLRSKEMYHQSPGQTEGEFSSGLYWCSRTCETFGPDGQTAGKSECCTGRSCYVG